TPEGFVGSSINVAARLCSIAGPGEVLVSDTVRSITAGVLSVEFEARGRQRLKGVSEPVAVFAVTDGAATPKRAAPRRVGLVASAIVIGGLAVVGMAALAVALSG